MIFAWLRASREEGVMKAILATASAFAISTSILVWNAAHALPINGVVNIATTTVGPTDPVSPDPNIARDLDFTNTIYGQIGISINSFADRVLKAGAVGVPWTRAQVASPGDDPLISPSHNITGGNSINVYYVPAYAPAVGQSWSAEDVPGRSQAVGVVLRAARSNDDLAHELGHVLLDNWRWRPLEAVAPGVHTSNPNDLMQVASNNPPNLQSIWPSGPLDRIGQTNFLTGSGAIKSIGSAGGTISPETSALYYNNTFVSITERAEITAKVEAASQKFLWGVQQTIGGLLVNEAARRIPRNEEELMFHFRNSTGFAAGSGGADGLLALEMDGISSVDFPYKIST